MTRLILLALLFPTLLQSQNPHFVISSNGLKLRAAPDQNSTVLAVAPFGARVQVLTRDTNQQDDLVQYDARRDTIGILPPNRYYRSETGHVGYWWQVRYRSQTGYMFSGFLADSFLLGWKRYDPAPELNDQFRLRTIGTNHEARNHPEFDPEWYWYGLYPEAEGLFSLKKIRLRYAVQDYTDEQGAYTFSTRDLVTLTDPPSDQVYIFGTRAPWTTRTGIDGFCSWDGHSRKTPEEVSAALKKYRIELIQNGPYKSDDEWYLLGPNGERQHVDPSGFLEKEEIENPIALAWAGDLDGDGRTDFIFETTFSAGSSGYVVLYLSSLARKGEVARPAAVLWLMYCC